MTKNTRKNINSSNKLNYLLVMPRLVQNIGDGYSFPLGIAYISSSMKKANFNVSTINLNHRDGDIYDILKREIADREIDVVATGGLSFQYNTVKLVIEAAKKINNSIITIVGGGIISGDPEPAMQALEYADFGVFGEGEITINELCKALESQEDFSQIEGIIYKDLDSYISTKPREQVRDLDSIAWPDYKGFDMDKYLEAAPPGISGLNIGNTIFMLARVS